jgi:sarcosine oxidase subunit alpha
MRITDHPYLRFERKDTVVIGFAGRRVEAYRGETVGAALYAGGWRVLSRSFKYHRPRGLFCMRGRCPNCLMRVNGVPNVRVCMEDVSDGMVVEPQHAWPSLDWDIYSVLDRLDFLLPVGFQYKRFIRPRLLWPLVERVMRRAAGLGGVPSPDAGQQLSYRREAWETDVLVIGGGPAGMNAAIEASDAGARVTLVDDDHELGGILKYRTRMLSEPGEYRDRLGFRLAEELRRAVQSREIRVLGRAVAFGIYEGNDVGVLQGQRYIRVRAKAVVVATGAHERPMVFVNSDLPGVLPSTGAQILMHGFGVKPGSSAIVATINEYGYEAAQQLLDAGVELRAIVDARFGFEQPWHQRVPIYRGEVLEALGRRAVRGALISSRGRRFKLPCDLICTSGGFQPAAELLLQAGCRMRMEAGGPRVEHDDHMMAGPGLFVAGYASGTTSLTQAMLEGMIAGIGAAEYAGRAGPEALRIREEYLGQLRALREGVQPHAEG